MFLVLLYVHYKHYQKLKLVNLKWLWSETEKQNRPGVEHWKTDQISLIWMEFLSSFAHKHHKMKKQHRKGPFATVSIFIFATSLLYCEILFEAEHNVICFVKQLLKIKLRYRFGLSTLFIENHSISLVANLLVCDLFIFSYYQRMDLDKSLKSKTFTSHVSLSPWQQAGDTLFPVKLQLKCMCNKIKAFIPFILVKWCMLWLYMFFPVVLH